MGGLYGKRSDFGNIIWSILSARWLAVACPGNASLTKKLQGSWSKTWQLCVNLPLLQWEAFLVGWENLKHLDLNRGLVLQSVLAEKEHAATIAWWHSGRFVCPLVSASETDCTNTQTVTHYLSSCEKKNESVQAFLLQRWRPAVSLQRGRRELRAAFIGSVAG